MSDSTIILRPSPLGCAAQSGNLKIVKALHSHGAIVNGYHRHRVGQAGIIICSPLHVASAFGHAEVVEYLLKAGADVQRGTELPDHPDKQSTPLWWAASGFGFTSPGPSKNGAHVIQILLKFGANPNDGCLLRTLDHWTKNPVRSQTNEPEISRRREEVLSTLLTSGAEPIVRPSTDWPSILYCGVTLGRVELVKLLIDAGARVRGYSRASLHLALSRNDLPMVELLVSRGANLQVRNEAGEPTLHAAAEELNGPMLELLLRLGADPNGLDSYDMKPAEVARDSLRRKYQHGDAVGNRKADEKVVKVLEALLVQ
ncbi:hypothetical protein HDV00_008884 [Rhizophlyctis rosea]|nr:hypothetical protein HDV00_008884 [Rhizophlyctis rosea]